MLNIAFSFDQRVADGTAALIASISRACEPEFVSLHGLYPNQERYFANEIARYAKRLGFTINLDPFDDDKLQSFPDQPTLPRAAFRRLFHPAILNERCDRYLYLDTDVLVMNCPMSLLQEACADKTLGVVRDLGVADLAEGLRFLPADRFLPGEPYFNSGVMIVNVPRWIENAYTEKIVAFAIEHSSKLRFGDQDAINFVLRNDIHLIDGRWNMMVGALDYQRRKNGHPKPSRRDLANQAQNAGMLHFSGGGKPWSKKWYVHHRGLYYDLLVRTGWKTQHQALRERLLNKLRGGVDSAVQLLSRRLRRKRRV